MRTNARKQIDPKTLRSHTKILARITDPLAVVGNKVQTDYGFVIQGKSFKSFETLFMTVAAGGATPVWNHPKKTRVLRVISGTGSFITGGTSTPISSGDELVAEANVDYQVVANTALELYVTQDAKYESSLGEVEASTVVTVPAELLQSLTAEEKMARLAPRTLVDRSERSEKARNAIRAMRGQPTITKQQSETTLDSMFRGASTGMNAQPITNFEEE